MRVLYCNPVFFEYRLPFYEELNRLFEGDFHVMYSPVRFRICGKEGFMEKVRDTLGANAHELKSDHVFDTHSFKFDRMPDIERGKRIPITWGLMRAIRKIKPDILITEGFFQWTPTVVMYGSLHKKPVYVGYERTLWNERNTNVIKRLQRKIINHFVKGFLANGIETQKYLESLNIKASKIHRIGMSADGTTLKDRVLAMPISEKDLFRQQFRYDKNGLIYLYSGRISHLKGAPHLLEAWAMHIKSHPCDHLVMIGMGDLYEQLRKQYRNYESVHLEGKIAYDEIHKYYAIADVFILPTLEDNWSLVVPEAMACGLPVATSVYNGCWPELIKEGINGTTFDTFDKASIVRTLDFFHGKNLKAMGEASMSIEQEYDTEHCARRVYAAITGMK